jgi:hypothetical protein
MKGMRSRFLITVCICFAVLGWSGCALTGDDPSEKVFIKYFGEDGNQEGVDMLVAADGFYLLGNTTKPQAGALEQQILLIKTDFQGNEIWRKSFGKAGKDEARDMEYTNTPNQIVMVGNLERTPGDQDCFIMTLNLSPSGATRIDSTSFGYAGFTEKVNSVSLTSDGFVTAGSTTNVFNKSNTELNSDLFDAMNFRFYANLSIFDPAWSPRTGFKASDESLKVFNRGNQNIMFGTTNSIFRTTQPSPNNNFWYAGLGLNGDAATSYERIGEANTEEVLSSVFLATDPANEGYLLAGIVKNSNNEGDIYVFKLKPTLGFNSGDRENDNVLQLSLGNVPGSKTAIGVAQRGGFFIVSNTLSPATGGSVDWLLTKVNPIGRLVWTTPFIFGGGGEDTIGAVQELSDGSIIVFGTFEIGSDRREKKMTLIKLTQEGKLQPE